MADKNYEILDVKAHPSGKGFNIKWRRLDNPTTTITSHKHSDNIDEAMDYIEKKAFEVVNKNPKLDNKVKELKDKFKQKGLMK